MLGTKPTIHRTIQIEENRSFFELHMAIQIAFGWQNSHMHIFDIGDDQIGMSDFDEFEDDFTIEEKTIILSQAGLNEKDIFVYIYDLGDHWVHKIKVNKIIEPKNTFYPKCTKGAMNCPPEDCGGIYGFEDFKEIIGNRKHPEFKEMKAWHGGMYDEELFQKHQINEDLKSFDSIIQEMLSGYEN